MPEILSDTFFLIVGLALLIYGANLLVQGCVKLSFLFKLSPLFIGIIVLAFGTSTPELAVGIIAALKNQSLMAVGNIIGSNIANIGLILGISGLLRPLLVKDKSIFKKELPLMITGVILLYILCLDHVLSRLDGVIFIVFFGFFCFISFKGAKLDSKNIAELKEFKFTKFFEKIDSKVLASIAAFISILIVLAGAHFMVRSGVSLAHRFGISTWLIGITVFAIGTSLPELAASVTATLKKMPSISIGNVIGSNIFNIFLVLGIVALIRPIPIQQASILKFEMPILLGFSIFLFASLRTGFKVTRSESAIMLVGYLVFLVFLIVR